MASITDYKVKTVRSEEVEDTPLPVVTAWDQIPDRPTTLNKLDPTAGATLASHSTSITEILGDIEGLGALAYEDLVTELQIANSAVTNAKIAVNAIQGDVIAALAITETKVATDAISSAKIQAGAIVAGKLAANSIVASNIQAGQIDATKMNVSQLSAITANMGSITAGTITGALIRTASSGTRIQLDYSSNEIQIYNGSVKRAVGYSQGWDYYNSSSQLVGSIYASSADLLIGASSGGEISTASIYYGAGVNGGHSFHVGLSGSTLRMYLDDNSMQIGDADNLAYSIDILGYVTFNYERGFRTPTVGSVSSGGVLTGGGVGWDASNDSTGVYTVYHYLGSSAYSVVATVQASSGDYKCKIGSKGSSSFTVRTDSAGVLTNAAFNFILIYY